MVKLWPTVGVCVVNGGVACNLIFLHGVSGLPWNLPNYEHTHRCHGSHILAAHSPATPSYRYHIIQCGNLIYCVSAAMGMCKKPTLDCALRYRVVFATMLVSSQLSLWLFNLSTLTNERSRRETPHPLCRWRCDCYLFSLVNLKLQHSVRKTVRLSAKCIHCVHIFVKVFLLS